MVHAPEATVASVAHFDQSPPLHPREYPHSAPPAFPTSKLLILQAYPSTSGTGVVEEMPAAKRNQDGTEKKNCSSISPFLPMFEFFRAELDHHHDRRERVIKGSRDITALSKKMSANFLMNFIDIYTDINRIFSMQR